MMEIQYSELVTVVGEIETYDNLDEFVTKTLKKRPSREGV